MKNIHILPTDRPSRLYRSDDDFILHQIPTTLFQMQNIYITSDEEIKEGDWCLPFLNGTVDTVTDQQEVYKVKNGDSYYEDKKIILTTDQDLIKDGVWGIEDGFLEWFVKNPTCEYVELKGYAIILPGESCDCDKICSECEAKQEPGKETADYIDRHIVEALVEVAKQKMYSEEDMKSSFQVGFNVGYNDEESPSYLTFEEWIKEYKKK
jgi:hypothetical protein